MSYETIVVAFTDAFRATEAVRAIRQMGVPPHDIKRHPADADTIQDVASAVADETGSRFWGWIFGRDTTEQRQVQLYQAALARGGTVISVRVMEDEAGRVRTMLASFGPLDLEEKPGLL